MTQKTLIVIFHMNDIIVDKRILILTSYFYFGIFFSFFNLTF